MCDIELNVYIFTGHFSPWPTHTETFLLRGNVTYLSEGQCRVSNSTDNTLHSSKWSVTCRSKGDVWG